MSDGTVAAPVSAPVAATQAPVSSAQDGTIAAPESVAQAKAELYDVPVGGKTVKMTLQEMRDSASMVKAANQRFDEAAQIRKQQEKFRGTVKSNPIQALLEEGATDDEIRDHFEKWYNEKYIEPESMSAEDRKIKEYEAKLKKYEENEKASKDRQEQEKQDKLTSQQRTHLQTQIIEALKSSKLPQGNPEIVKRIAFFMRQNLNNGWDAPMDMIVRQVQTERQEMFKPDLVTTPIPEFLELYGEDGKAFINRIRQFDLEQLRQKRAERTPGFSANNSTRVSTNPIEQGEKVSYKDVNQRLREMRTGKYY